MLPTSTVGQKRAQTCPTKMEQMLDMRGDKKTLKIQVVGFKIQDSRASVVQPNYINTVHFEL